MQILNIFHVLIAMALVGFVLIQKGQGATAGAAFGSGASGTVFGARGAGNFLSRTTWVLATLFCALSLTIAVLVSRTADLPESDLGVVDSVVTAPQAADETVPGTDGTSNQNETSEIGLPVFETEAVESEALDTQDAANDPDSDIPDLPGFDESAPSADDVTDGGSDSATGTDSEGS